MSLFPAAQSTLERLPPEEPEKQWLQNDSYLTSHNPGLVVHDEVLSCSTSEDEYVQENVKKTKKINKKFKKKIEESKPPKRINELGAKGKIQAVGSHLPGLEDKFYFVDTQSDRDNLYFQRPYNVIVPRFYRPIVYCVGTPAYVNLDIGESKKIKSKKHKHNLIEQDRYFNKQNKKLFLTPGEYVGRENSSSGDSCYIRIKQATSEDNIKSEFSISARTEYLNKFLRENPKDIKSWLSLISLQNEAIDGNLKNREKILIEKKVAILDRAIEENKRNVLLKRMKLELLSKITSDYSTLESQWKETLFKFADDLDLWESFLQYMTSSNTIKFTVQKTEKSFCRCLSVLRAMQAGSFSTSLSRNIVETNALRIFKQYVEFLWGSGFANKCLLVILYLLEFNLRQPESATDIQFNTLLDSLEKYYLCTEAKLGTDDSRGWGQWYSKYCKGGWTNIDVKNHDDIDDKMEYEESLCDNEKSLAQNWLVVENFRSAVDFKNIHSFSNKNFENFISFGSFKQAMFLVKSDKLKIDMCKLLLHVIGTPLNYNTTSDISFQKQGLYSWLDGDTFLQKDFANFYLIKPFLYFKNSSADVMKQEYIHKLLLDIFEQLLIANKHNVQLKNMLSIELMEYIENRILVLISLNHIKNLKTSAKEARKTAKYILKQQPSLFEVWKSLCTIEWILGNFVESVRILQQFISLTVEQHKGTQGMNLFKTSEFKGAMQICKNIAELYWQSFISGKNIPVKVTNTILLCLCALGDDQKFSHYFTKVDDENLVSISATEQTKILPMWNRNLNLLKTDYSPNNEICNGTSTYISYAVCCIVFNLMIKNVNHIFEIFDDIISFLETKDKTSQLNCDFEHLLLLKTYILWHLNVSNAIKRQAMYFASTKYKNNPYFNKVLCEIDISSYLSANVQRHFSKICSEDTVIPWLFAINYELERIKHLSKENLQLDSINNKVYNLLKKATASKSPLIWRMYLSLAAKSPKELVKEVYLKAIDSCPWARQIYIDVIKLCPDMLEPVIKTMEDNGLHVHTQVEEIELMVM